MSDTAGNTGGDTTEDQISALRRCLALHDELLWILGQVGGRFTGVKKLARNTYIGQRRARDEVRAALDDREAAAPPPAYEIRRPADPDDARRLVRDTLDRQHEAYLVLIGNSDGKARSRWIRALQSGAVTQMQWGGHPLAFPGLDRQPGRDGQ